MRPIRSSTESTNRGINQRQAWRLSRRCTPTPLVLCRCNPTYHILPQAKLTLRIFRHHHNHRSSTTIFPSKYTPNSSLQLISFNRYPSRHITRFPLKGRKNSLKPRALSCKNHPLMRTSAGSKRRHNKPDKFSKISKIRCHSAPYTKTPRGKVKKFQTFKSWETQRKTNRTRRQLKRTE